MKVDTAKPEDTSEARYAYRDNFMMNTDQGTLYINQVIADQTSGACCLCSFCMYKNESHARRSGRAWTASGGNLTGERRHVQDKQENREPF